MAKSHKSLASQINAYMKSLAKNISSERVYQDIKPVIYELVQSSDAYQSMTNYDGELFAYFGFPAGKQKNMVDAVIERLIETADFKITALSVGVKYVFNISFEVDIDKSGALELPEAVIETAKNTKNAPLKWAKWILKRGDSIVIKDYILDFDSELHNEESRSGTDTYMIYNPSYTGFAVPSEFSGTNENNFMSRALIYNGDFHPKILNALRDSVIKELGRVYNGGL